MSILRSILNSNVIIAVSIKFNNYESTLVNYCDINLVLLKVATYIFYLHFSALYLIYMPAVAKFANFTITALNVKVKIKLTISDISNNESMLETCISSEPESLLTSNC